MMAACSQDEVVGVNQDGIAYSVSAGMQTRAADSYCNNILPSSFKVWAQSSEGLYINGDRIVDNNGVWTDESGTRYWPDGKTLDFYAEVNGDEVFSFNAGAPSFNDFTVEDNVGNQRDLMYSVRKGQSRSVDKVHLNFRHALSQVCFRAKNNTKTMSVVIKGVSVGHLTNQGTFTFPVTDTDDNYAHHSDEPDDKELNGGVWSLPTDAQYNKRYDVTPLGGDATLAPGTACNLTCPEENHRSGFDQTLTLLPQTVNAWNPKNAEKKYDGAYFLLNLEFSNITKDDAGKEVATTLYSGKAAIPVSVAWEQGYRYIYTFVFDEGGNGGWTPYPDPDDPDGPDYPDDPEPVLATIKYDVKVDDFIPVNPDGEDGTHMDTGESGSYAYSSTLNLHLNDGTGKTTSLKVDSNTTPYSFTVPSEYIPTRDGYTFLGWATAADAEKADYAQGAPVSLDMEKESNDLYAVWEAKVVFEWTFELQGGTEPDPQNAKFGGWKATSGRWNDGDTRPLPNVEPLREGYTFKGWAMSEDGEVRYQAGERVTLDKDNPVLVFYAVWVEDETTIKFVDLGLPSGTLWADRNLGSTSISDPGFYVGWGDNTGNMISGSGGDYPIFSPRYNAGYTAFSNIEFGGLNGAYSGYYNNISGNKEYDVAANLSNGEYCMPKPSNFIELVNNTTTKETVIDGVSCYVFTGKNGNSITIPLAGVKLGSSSLLYGKAFSLWTDQCFYINRMYGNDDGDNAVTFSNEEIADVFVGGAEFLYFIEKSYRSSIRPIKAKN